MTRRLLSGVETLGELLVARHELDARDGLDTATFVSGYPGSPLGTFDLALGRLVEAVSKSKFWPQTAVFVVEDDAQNGPDHVDAHRTVGLVISPYTKRKSVDHSQYSTASMIRTMELILGLAPLSQFDAAATPMFASFTDAADSRAYRLEDARIDLNARNTQLAYGAERSKAMDFSAEDKIDDFALNEILWHAVKGVDAPLPPAVRRNPGAHACSPCRSSSARRAPPGSPTSRLNGS